MSRIDLNNIQSFILVARERSFTRAAAQLGVSQSALSHSMRALEAKLGVRLLARSTRGVATTEAGERLLQNVAGYFEGIETELALLDDFRGAPSGSFRITAFDHPADTVLWPKLSKLLREYPALSVEIDVNYVLVDIVADRFDAGVRYGDQVAKDMIAVRIAPDQQIVVVATPEYLERRPPPASPRDLSRHDCVNLRLPTRHLYYSSRRQSSPGFLLIVEALRYKP